MASTFRVHVCHSYSFLHFSFFCPLLERKIILAWNAKFPRLIRNTHWNYSLLFSLLLNVLLLGGNILYPKKRAVAVWDRAVCVREMNWRITSVMGSLSLSYILRILFSTSTMAHKREKTFFVLKYFFLMKLGFRLKETLIVWKCKSWKRAKSEACGGMESEKVH